jgi:hypothetical protein
MPVKASHIHQSNENDLLPVQRASDEQRLDSLVLLIVEFSEAEYDQTSEAEEHGVEENESRDAKPGDV